MNRFRYQYTPNGSQWLKARGNIYSIAKNIFTFKHHLSEMDTNPAVLLALGLGTLALAGRRR